MTTVAGNVSGIAGVRPRSVTRRIEESARLERLGALAIEAERALLGAILTGSRTAVERSVRLLRPEHFFDPAHARIFTAAATLAERGQIPTPVTLRPYVEDDRTLVDLGGSGYLADLVAGVVTVSNPEDFARSVHDFWKRRQLLEMAGKLAEEAVTFSLDGTACDIIERAGSELSVLLDDGPATVPIRSMADAALEAVGRADAAFRSGTGLTGVTTGFRDIDSRTGGLQPGDLIVLAGRPSMGKTGLALNIAVRTARVARDKAPHGGPVAFFSQEMGAGQQGANLLAALTGVSAQRQRTGQVTPADFRRFAECLPEADLPISIDETSRVSVSHVRRRARQIGRRHGLGLIIVDHLQLMSERGRHENRRLEIGAITAGLKAVGKEFGVPVMLLSQLSRQVEQREDKRPQLSDLRESGDIEQDADVVMFMFREGYYLERNEPSRRPDEGEEAFNDRRRRWECRLREQATTAEVVIAKQRMGPVGTVRLFFDPERSRFDDLEPHHG